MIKGTLNVNCVMTVLIDSLVTSEVTRINTSVLLFKDFMGYKLSKVYL